MAVPGIALVAGLWLAAGPVRAEEPSAEPATVRKTKDGLQFQLPPDWPIETRGGITAPIPLEEYLGWKFKTIDARLQGLEQRLGGFDIRLRALEEEAKTLRQRLQSIEQPPALSGVQAGQPSAPVTAPAEAAR